MGRLVGKATHNHGDTAVVRDVETEREPAFGAPASRTDSVCSGKNNARLKGLLTLG